jgi:hypothetical protein
VPGVTYAIALEAHRWEESYFRPTSAYPRSRGTFHKHLVQADIAKVRIREVTTGRVEQFIQAKTRELAPQTVNHLRAFLCRVFSAARRAGKVAQNPVLNILTQDRCQKFGVC